MCYVVVSVKKQMGHEVVGWVSWSNEWRVGRSGLPRVGGVSESKERRVGRIVNGRVSCRAVS